MTLTMVQAMPTTTSVTARGTPIQAGRNSLPSKMTFYLDPMTPDTGCLRVIPGSHRIDSYWHRSLDPDWRNGRGNINLNDAEAVWGLPPSDIPGSVALETNPGDLVFFNHTIFHASFGGGNRRRMFTLNLTKRGKTEAEIARVDEYLTTNCPTAHGFKFGGMYTDLTIDTATPERPETHDPVS